MGEIALIMCNNVPMTDKITASLSCSRCGKNDNLTVFGLCESCAERFFKNGVGTAALSKLLGIGSNRLLKYEKSGELIPDRKNYGTRVYHRGDVEKLLRSRYIKGVRKYRTLSDKR